MQNYAGSWINSARINTTVVSFVSLLALWWALLYIFYTFPQIDIAAARSVFTPRGCTVHDAIDKTCGIFSLETDPFFVAARTVLLILPYVVVAGLLGLIVVSLWQLGKDWKTPQVKMVLASLLSLAIGCGLLVNLLLKEFAGRPRPRDTILFGGNLDFVQAGSFVGKCLKNCSFVSGEASSAGWLFCLILLLPERWRLPVGFPVAVISIVIPTMRVLTGAHYLSDAVLGWLSSVVIFAGVLVILETLHHRRDAA